MGDYISKVRQSIDEAIDFFLKRINEISENGPYRKARRIPTTFPMLRLGNDEFYEYAYFERTLEWFVRDLLINTILHDLLTIHNIESMWPDNKTTLDIARNLLRTSSRLNLYLSIMAKRQVCVILVCAPVKQLNW